MTLNIAIDKQLLNFSLTPIAEAQYLHHLYADYFELIALFSNGDFVPASNLVSRLYSEGVDIAEEVDRGTGDEIGLVNDQINDKKEAWGLETFSVIKDRADVFRDNYPFQIEGTGIALKNNLHSTQRIYLMLLVSSSLKNFPVLAPRLTTEFEQISFVALKNFLPNQAIVKQFGKNSDYNGAATEKIRKLAGDMGLEVVESELATISPQNTQEEGLDLVGWIPFDDNIPSMVSIFAQCACGKAWSHKQTETRRYEQFLNFYKVSPIHALFVPYALGHPMRQFYQSKDIINGSLVFDRKRIIHLMEDTAFFNDLESKEIVDRFIDYAEDLV